MKWICSEGGPLLLLEKKFLHLWGGTWSNDYDRACRTTEYAELIGIGDVSGLVIGDEPYQTSLYHEHDFRGLVSWQWADSESAIILALASIDSDKLQFEKEVKWDISSGELILFDSAAAGREATGLEFTIPHGSYHIRTFIYRPDVSMSIVIHEFKMSD